MKENWYTLHMSTNRAVINKSGILGATVLPKRNRRAGIPESIITMTREAEYTFGQNKFLLQKFITENSQLKINNHLTPLVQFLEEFDKSVYLSENNASYVDSAFMYTRSRKIFGLYWPSGFHQILFLQGRNFKKGSKKLAFYCLGGKI